MWIIVWFSRNCTYSYIDIVDIDDDTVIIDISRYISVQPSFNDSIIYISRETLGIHQDPVCLMP